jgi:hypothetical protein
MWKFPYTFGFCNPVQIYGRKINDDDDNDDYDDGVERDLPVLFFNYLKFKQSTFLDVYNFFQGIFFIYIVNFVWKSFQ